MRATQSISSGVGEKGLLRMSWAKQAKRDVSARRAISGKPFAAHCQAETVSARKVK
jgi:hypothetical protein